MAHVYLVTTKDTVIGIYSNRTWMCGLLSSLFEKCYIEGGRKQLEVSAASIGTHMPDRFLKLYDKTTETVAYRIWDLTVNNTNPDLKIGGSE